MQSFIVWLSHPFNMNSVGLVFDLYLLAQLNLDANLDINLVKRIIDCLDNLQHGLHRLF